MAASRKISQTTVFKSPFSWVLVFIVWTTVIPFSAMANSQSCPSFYYTKKTSQKDLSGIEIPFVNWVRTTFWGVDSSGVPLSKVLESMSLSMVEFEDVIQSLSPAQKDELFLFIRRDYAELTRKKNEGDIESNRLRKIMDGFLNIEMDRVSASIQTVDDLKRVFTWIDKFLLNSESLTFEDVLFSAQYFQTKLNEKRKLISYLVKKQTPNKGYRLRADILREQLLTELRAAEGTKNLKLWLYGSVVNGRRVKEASDFDFYLPESLETILSDYFERDPGILELANKLGVREITSLGTDPVNALPAKELSRSRWVVEVTPTKINFLIYDPSTKKMRQLK